MTQDGYKSLLFERLTTTDSKSIIFHNPLYFNIIHIILKKITKYKAQTIHEKYNFHSKNFAVRQLLKEKAKGEETQGTGHKRKGLLHQ